MVHPLPHPPHSALLPLGALRLARVLDDSTAGASGKVHGHQVGLRLGLQAHTHEKKQQQQQKVTFIVCLCAHFALRQVGSIQIALGPLGLLEVTLQLLPILTHTDNTHTKWVKTSVTPRADWSKAIESNLKQSEGRGPAGSGLLAVGAQHLHMVKADRTS